MQPACSVVASGLATEARIKGWADEPRITDNGLHVGGQLGQRSQPASKQASNPPQGFFYRTREWEAAGVMLVLLCALLAARKPAICRHQMHGLLASILLRRSPASERLQFVDYGT
jgi:hypothetical protein